MTGAFGGGMPWRGRGRGWREGLSGLVEGESGAVSELDRWMRLLWARDDGPDERRRVGSRRRQAVWKEDVVGRQDRSSDMLLLSALARRTPPSRPQALPVASSLSSPLPMTPVTCS